MATSVPAVASTLASLGSLWVASLTYHHLKEERRSGEVRLLRDAALPMLTKVGICLEQEKAVSLRLEEIGKTTLSKKRLFRGGCALEYQNLRRLFLSTPYESEATKRMVNAMTSCSNDVHSVTLDRIFLSCPDGALDEYVNKSRKNCEDVVLAAIAAVSNGSEPKLDDSPFGEHADKFLQECKK